MAATLTKLIKARTITLTRAEGLHAEVDKPIMLHKWQHPDIWAAADKVLFNWSATAPKEGGYDKCDFIIEYEDGEKYTGRYDLKHYIVEYPHLDSHVYDFVRFTAGKYRGALSQEEYDQFKKQEHMKKLMPSFQHFLEKYEIGSLNVTEFNPEVSPYKTPPLRHEVPTFGEEGAVPKYKPKAEGRRKVIEARLKRGESVPQKYLEEFPDLAATQYRAENEPTKEQESALKKLGPYRVLHIHNDGDRTVEVHGQKYVVTTDGEVFVHHTGDFKAKTQQVVEKGWKDFFKGNRIQAMIDSTNYRIKARNVSEVEQKRLHESLKTDLKDLVEYQNLQSWGFASGLLTQGEADLLYRIFGGESPSPEKWDKLTLGEKVAATKLVDELLGVKLKKRGFSARTLPEIAKDAPLLQTKDMKTYITVIDPGKTTFTKGAVVSPETFAKENERVRKLGGKEAIGWTGAEGKWPHDGNGGGSDNMALLPSTIDLRNNYDEKASVNKGTLYRKGSVIQVWWDKWGKETWSGPDEDDAKRNFRAMKERWTEPISAQACNEPQRRTRQENDIELLPDSPEYLAQTIDNSGWREQLDKEFQLAVSRTRG